MRRLLRPGTALAAALLTVITTPSALAESQTRSDPASDVIAVNEDGSNPVARPAVRDVDVRHTTISYRDERLRIVVTLRDLGSNDFEAGFPIKTPSGRYTGRWTQTDGFVDVDLRVPLAARGRGRGCDGLGRIRNDELDRIGIVIPYECLDAPAWVRVGVGVVRWLSETRALIDDGRTGDPFTSPFKLGPQLAYG